DRIIQKPFCPDIGFRKIRSETRSPSRSAMADSSHSRSLPKMRTVSLRLLKIKATCPSKNTSVASRTAIAAARSRTPSWPLVTAASHAALHEQHTATRFEGINLVIDWAMQSETLTNTLKWVAQNDPDTRLREMASGALQKLARTG